MYGHVITKFSRMGSLPHFLTHGAPLRAARARAPLLCIYTLSVQLVASSRYRSSCNLSSRERVGGFVLFLIGQSFESEPHQDSPLCFQDGQLILLGLSQVPRYQ